MSLRAFALSVAALLVPAMAALPAAAQTARPEPYRVTGPATHEGLSIFFLRGTSTPGPVPLTLDEALKKGSIEVHETGVVSELRIENRGDEPVFVQLGDIVKGGRQDRVLTVSLLLEPRSGVIPIGAFCVEQGRWAARGKEDARRFALSEALLPSRTAKLAIARPRPADAITGVTTAAVPTPSSGGTSAEATARGPRSPIEAELARRALEVERRDLAQRHQRQEPAPLGSQSEVWQTVGRLQQELSARLAAPVESGQSRTSLQLSLENATLQTALAGYTGALEAAGADGTDIIGAVVVLGGRIASADVYPSNGLFRKMWPKLLKAAATEALASGAGKPERPVDGPAVAAFLASAPAAGPGERTIAGAVRIATTESETVLRVLASAGPSDARRMVHESFIAK
jgi:hypothetical protein